jgi:5'-nucleotidase
VTQVRDRWFMVDGTPTDCVMLAVRDLLSRRPALVVSGINRGANLGDDVTYSGTVAGAFEGMLLGLPSIAVSDVSYDPVHMETAGVWAARVAARVLREGLPRDVMLNVNVPDLPADAVQGAVVTRMGRRNYQDEIVCRMDPRGKAYYWIGGSAPTHETEEGTDFEAIEAGKVSVTPLRRDLTDHNALRALAALDWSDPA